MTMTPEHKTPEQIFKDAWHQADSEGDFGNRVKRGLDALRAVGLLVEGAPTDGALDHLALWRVMYTDESRDCDGFYPLGPFYVLAAHEDDAWNAADAIPKPDDWPNTTGIYEARFATPEEASEFTAGAASQGAPTEERIERPADRPCPHMPKGESRRAGECQRCAIESGWVIAAAGVAPVTPSEATATSEEDQRAELRYLRAELEAAQSAAKPSQELTNAEILERIAERERESAGAPAPSLDREKLIAEVVAEHSVEFHHPEFGVGLFTTCVEEIATALAAPPIVDPEKIAEVLAAHHQVRWRGEPKCACGEPLTSTGRYVLAEHQARAVVEALGGGR